MLAGLKIIDRWLDDVLQVGVLDYAFTISNIEPVASRLTDTQLPRLAKILRQLPNEDLGHPNWENKIQTKLSFILLLSRSMEKWEDWDTLQKLSLLQQLGFTIRAKSLLSKSYYTDLLWFYAVEITEEDNLRTRKCYAYAVNQGKFLGLIDFAFGRSSFGFDIAVNEFFDANVYHYPNPIPWRAHLTGPTKSSGNATIDLRYSDSFQSIQQQFAMAMLKQPWINEWPCAIRNVRILFDQNQQIVLVDLNGKSIKLAHYHSTQQRLELVSFGMLQPIQVIGLFRNNMIQLQYAQSGSRLWFASV